ncbi:NAD(P)-binding protein [Acrodontium crateriforme]|uniref:NAD(P)-binding protein n=1 Tax=Acrodontium crateriforme TaxID=150365 RepID=A0AAQ3R847_9PEZI|nr:NAD(P)-binding protein [Acrodontium crateriforme]
MNANPILVPSASLHGKVALVTGGSRGIGKGCALELARRGCNVIINYLRNAQNARDLVQEIEASGVAKAIAIQTDVSKVADIEALFQAGKAHFGKIDIVLSNSGTESWDKTEDVTEETYDRVFGLNTKAQFFVGQAAWKHVEDGGRVILMSSISAGMVGVKDHALYNASKMAVIGIVKAFATDFGARRITVNGIAPGGVKSDMFTENAWRYIPGATADWPEDKIDTLVSARTPLGRCAQPEDIARAVAFLASGDGEWVNGQVITLAGGYA